MIEIKELQVGSYFHPTFETPDGSRLVDENLFYRVDCLTTVPPTVAYFLPNSKKAVPYTVDQIEPVQLNDDILERCGFAPHGDYWQHKGQPFAIHLNGTTFAGQRIKHCEWLHQLQRAWDAVVGHTLPFVPPVPVRKMRNKF